MFREQKVCHDHVSKQDNSLKGLIVVNSIAALKRKFI